MPNVAPTALTMDDIGRLGEVLDDHSPFDLDGVRGLLHAVGVAPSLLHPSVWVRAIFPGGLDELEQHEVNECIEILLLQYHEVTQALEAGSTVAPEPDDLDSCESFAGGYVAGARLDPAWAGVDVRWTFAGPFAYLADLRDLVSPGDLAELERDFQPDPKQAIRQHLGTLIQGAREAFEVERRAHASPPRCAPAHPGRIGRNDPCPCGSGKKYKRCCAIKNDAMN